MKKDCSIVEDLMPLYLEDLLQEDTVAWIEDHATRCESCKKMIALSKEKLTEEIRVPQKSAQKMMKKIQMKLNLYQILFVCISFVFAMQTSLMNDDFGFILSYALLGFVLYYFYQNYKMVIVITLLPTFFWSMGMTLMDLNPDVAGSIFLQLFQVTIGSLYLSVIHVIFAVIGGTIGFLLFKLKEGGSV